MLSFPPRTHDLLRLSSLDLAQASALRPAWADVALKTSPWVVVRRAHVDGSRVPVGVRGTQRAQRWAGFVSPDQIAQIVSPNQLRQSLAETSRRGLRAFESLRFLETKIALNTLDWGPGGRTGFELASGSPTITETSDLDIVIRAPEPFDRAFARSICLQFEGAPARVDALVETPCCGFSLEEYAHSPLDKVLVRTATGRLFAEDPWDARIGRQPWS